MCHHTTEHLSTKSKHHQLLTTTSWHPPPAVGSCRRGRRLPAADVAPRRSAFSGQACCPWSAASPPHSRCSGKCSAVQTWAESQEASCSGPGRKRWVESNWSVSIILQSTLSVTLSSPFLPTLVFKNINQNCVELKLLHYPSIHQRLLV